MNASVVSVFGGSAARPGDDTWREAEAFAARLARAGVTIATGGYGGVMEAASRGAAAQGGRVLGVTCDDIEAWRGVRPNAYLGEEVRVPRLRDRVVRLMEMGDALAAFPGGVGTLSEVALSWSMLQTGALTPRPFVLVGEGWRAVLRTFLDTAQGFLHPDDEGLLGFAPNGELAAETILRYLAGRQPAL
jgi:uncharacterized protein (TIGR00730 family)